MAEQLVAEVERLRVSEPVDNPLLTVPADAEQETERLRRLVAVEARAHAAELSAYGTVLSRFPRPPVADLCLTMGRVVHEAGPKLGRVADALGMRDPFSCHHPAAHGAFPFNAALSHAAQAGNQTAFGLAAHTDMAVYYPGCRALVEQLRKRNARVPEEFFAYFDDPGDEQLLDLAVTVVQDGLDRGDDPREAVLHARRVEEAIGEAWRTAAGGTTPLHMQQG